jgi:CheY-like chemotaxis protein
MARILIVDDDPDGREVLAKYFTAISHTPIAAVDGGAALRSLMDARADAIVLDLNMPGMDGLGFLQIIRSYIRLSRIPVVVVTGTSLNQAAIDELEHNAVRHIFQKGRFRLRELASAIDEILGVAGTQDVREVKPKQPPRQSDAPDGRPGPPMA